MASDIRFDHMTTPELWTLFKATADAGFPEDKQWCKELLAYLSERPDCRGGRAEVKG